MKPTHLRAESSAKDPDSNRVFVLVGQAVVRSAPCSLITVLGSCVSVCLWSAERRIGGLNHYLLPVASPNGTEYLGGNLATAVLLDHMLANGCRMRSLVAKVFGGAQSGCGPWNIGADNILTAWQALSKMGIPIVNADVGGTFGRQLRFDVNTGQVQVRRVNFCLV